MQRAMLVAAALVAAWLAAGAAFAAVSVQGNVAIVFGPEARRIINEYYTTEIVDEAWGKHKDKKAKAKGKKGLPPGLAKKEKLPPGIRKQLERNGTLPPGLEREMQPLPRVLETRLPPLPPDRVRVVVGTDVIILDKTSQKILDIIRDVALLHHDITK